MSRSRTFVFKIDNYEKKDWNFVCDLEDTGKCEYICACKCSTSINGFIRFYNSKYLTSLEKLFQNKAIIEIEKNNDSYYKELFSKKESFFEAGKLVKNTKRIDKNILKIVEEKDEIINQFVKNQQEKDKLIKQLVENQLVNQEDKDKMISKLVENQTNITKQITEICLSMAKSSPITMLHNTINHNTNTNVKFNLNVFLNEHCKDALNLIDFAKSIQIKLEDVLLYKKLGHVEAVTQIFDKAYKNLDLKMRPIHCTDVKRETLYVKNDNKWLNDETKELSEKAMNIVSDNSLRQLKKWKEDNPDYNDNEDKKHEYMVLMKHLLGGSSDREVEENQKKIIKNLSKNTQLDRDEALILPLEQNN
jgi:hypothetical protein